VVRYNGIMTPSWLVNGSFTWGHNHLTDTPTQPNVYNITDSVQALPCSVTNDLFGAILNLVQCTSSDNVLRGTFTRQGYGFLENTSGDTYGFNLDTSKRRTSSESTTSVSVIA